MKTIYQATGMKIILIAVITIIGISLFSAFKQSEGSKKYLTMTISGKDLYIIDENGVVTEKKIEDLFYHLKGTIDVTKEINSISSKGYHLISHNGQGTYFFIFEKE
jgi:hypothetical protein